MLRLHTLGSLVVRGRKGSAPLVGQPKHLTFLAFLAVEAAEVGVQRDPLLPLFWPDFDQERARHALRQTTYHLRQLVGADVLRSVGQNQLGLNPHALWCDAAEVLDSTAEPLRVCELYRGEFLPGVYVPNASNALADWVETVRRAARERAAEASWELSRAAEEEGAKRQAARWAIAAARLQPLNEFTVRELLETLVRLGDTARAMVEYRAFEERLAAEFEMRPSPATRALARAIREDRAVPLEERSRPPVPNRAAQRRRRAEPTPPMP